MMRHLATVIIGVLTTVHVSSVATSLASGAINDAAASAVERPGEQYRGRYQAGLSESRRLLA